MSIGQFYRSPTVGMKAIHLSSCYIAVTLHIEAEEIDDIQRMKSHYIFYYIQCTRLITHVLRAIFLDINYHKRNNNFKIVRVHCT